MATVLIRGDGVAACCCVRLLELGGLRPIVAVGDRPKVPAVMVGEATQKLLRDVFERDGLFDGLPRVHQRVVAWGAESKAVRLPHSAIVVSEQLLLERLRQPLLNTLVSDEADWSVLASRPLPGSPVEHHFGSRTGTASKVLLRTGCDSHTCWAESLAAGWLFLLPGASEGDGEGGWLLAVGDSAGSLLGQSRMVADQIAEITATAGNFPCYPRIVEPLCQPGWLACGTAAVGFDPLCGDGTGYATREAILGSAVVRAALDGADVEALSAHYTARLVAGFQRHLEVCRQFYESGGTGPWWRQEADALRRGLDWCRSTLAAAPPFRFRLNGFSLEAVE